jgi:hypothetical protein
MNSNNNYNYNNIILNDDDNNSPINTPPFNPINADNNIPHLILNDNNIINDTTNLIQLYNNYIYYILYTMTFYNNIQG